MSVEGKVNLDDPSEDDAEIEARLEAWRSRPCYVVVSPYKTASTTVGDALVEIGAGHRVMPYRGKLLRARKPGFKKWAKRLAAFDDAGSFVEAKQDDVRANFRRFCARLTDFDVFADAPLGHGHVHPVLIKCLAPLARFIWVDRPVESWLRSVRHWEETHPDTYPNHGIWQSDPETRIAQAMEMRTARYDNFRVAAANYPGDCLEMPISELEDFSRLAAFAGVADPGRPLRKSNVSLPQQ